MYKNTTICHINLAILHNLQRSIMTLFVDIATKILKNSNLHIREMSAKMESIRNYTNGSAETKENNFINLMTCTAGNI